MSRIVRLLASGILIITLMAGCSVVHAAVPGDGDRLTLTYGPYIHHFRSHPDHNEYPGYTSIEWESARQWELGAAYFRNSYDQPSGYLYGGRRWNYGDEGNQLFCKLTAGALLGYVGEHERKIPVNWNGLGLGIIPAVGYQYRRVSTQVVILGISGVMFTVGYDFWP